jgi:hypothetical protein
VIRAARRRRGGGGARRRRVAACGFALAVKRRAIRRFTANAKPQARFRDSGKYKSVLHI